jgi:hypothetical protein
MASERLLETERLRQATEKLHALKSSNADKITKQALRRHILMDYLIGDFLSDEQLSRL